MAFDQVLAERIRDLVRGEPAISERKMFGGIAFMQEGRMFAGIIGADLMVKLGRAGAEAALERPHVRVMDFNGRVSQGMVFVEPPATASDDDLRRWLDAGKTYVATAPAPKSRKTST
jgi:TfoX/Sxy family transcriptional regulator of competence genes